MKDELNYKIVFDNLNTAVVMLNSSMRLRYLNPAAEMLLAISSNVATGTLFNEYFQEAENTRHALIKAVTHNVKFTQRRAVWQIHTGKKQIVDYTITPLTDQRGCVIEITPLDRLLRISREESLISSQETSRNLVRSMAHEIKNPLGGIRGAAQLLSRELNSPDLEEFTQIIIKEADRLRNLVDLMLGPRQLPKLCSINIHEILEHVITVINASEANTDINLSRNYDPSIPNIKGDKDQLIQSILNIIRNATQSLRENKTQTAQIEIKTRIQRHFTIGGEYHPLVCCVRITDNGPGIAESMIDEIFYPMITGRAEGTGLGLAIAQNLIQQHKGLVECSSQPGQTIFSIYLPLEH
jgi:two-component system nitrogen regulation sensor histidine kinase GlnL